MTNGLQPVVPRALEVRCPCGHLDKEHNWDGTCQQSDDCGCTLDYAGAQRAHLCESGCQRPGSTDWWECAAVATGYSRDSLQARRLGCACRCHKFYRAVTAEEIATAGASK